MYITEKLSISLGQPQLEGEEPVDLKQEVLDVASRYLNLGIKLLVIELFPAPGGPVIPIRYALPIYLYISDINLLLIGSQRSTSDMDCEINIREFLRIPFINFGNTQKNNIMN